jgi:hypothetical protein
MSYNKFNLFIFLSLLPGVLSCSDSTTFRFGRYKVGDKVTIRTCEWLTINPYQAKIRIDKWCGRTHKGGKRISEWCPVSCGVTCEPTPAPTLAPTKNSDPTSSPTRPPSPAPSPFPSARPSNSPSKSPSDIPSTKPTKSPSSMPSPFPTERPTSSPSIKPSEQPSVYLSHRPSLIPSVLPTMLPSVPPSENPTNSPTVSIKPSPSPSAAPSFKATVKSPFNSICVDVEGKFKITDVEVGVINRNCDWAGKKDIDFRCALDGVAEKCPVTCETCASNYPSISPIPGKACADSELRLRFKTKRGKNISRYCSWVRNKDTDSRCKIEGVAAACPETCGTCNICKDPAANVRFRFTYLGEEILKNCDFINRVPSKIWKRCQSSNNICRESCKACG